MKTRTIAAGLILILSFAPQVAAREPGQHDNHGVVPGQNERGAPPAVEVGNKICPVSGQEVGKMGPAVKHEYKGKVYNLCCAGCKEIFNKDPEKYSKIAEEALK